MLCIFNILVISTIQNYQLKSAIQFNYAISTEYRIITSATLKMASQEETDDDAYQHISYIEGYNDGDKIRERMDQEFRDVKMRLSDIFKVLKCCVVTITFLLVAIFILLIIIFIHSNATHEAIENKSDSDEPLHSLSHPSHEPTSPTTRSIVSTTMNWSTPPATSSIPLTTTPIVCGDGWVDGHSVGMGCLLFKKTLKSHSEAKTFCQGYQNSALVEVYSPDQLNFLRGKLSALGSDWWGGATDERTEGSWHWPRSGAGVVQGVWAPGYPSRNSNQNFFCFSQQFDFYGVDVDNSDGRFRKYPICQKL